MRLDKPSLPVSLDGDNGFGFVGIRVMREAMIMADACGVGGVSL